MDETPAQPNRWRRLLEWLHRYRYALAPLSFGESWHNNHHAFPTSAEHGMRRWEIDPSALTIRALEKVGLVWDVVRVDRNCQERRAALLTEERQTV